MPIGIERLPIELLYEVQLFALSPSFPHSSKRIYHVFKTAPNSYIAQYIFYRIGSDSGAGESNFYTRALRYPSCNKDVMEILFRLLSDESAKQKVPCELPRRLFQNLRPARGTRPPWTDSDEPLPFLRYLYTAPQLHPDLNSHEGYALARAVHARHEPLIQFLLEHGASPSFKRGLCVMIAIRQRDLGLVRMLVERGDKSMARETGKDKKRRLEDRVGVSKDMLKLAVQCGARDIAEYFTQEKGIIPDIQTLMGI